MQFISVNEHKYVIMDAIVTNHKGVNEYCLTFTFFEEYPDGANNKGFTLDTGIYGTSICDLFMKVKQISYTGMLDELEVASIGIVIDSTTGDKVEDIDWNQCEQLVSGEAYNIH